jgi:hypothetical protein
MARTFQARRAGTCAITFCRGPIRRGQWIRRVYDRSRDGYGTDQYGHAGCVNQYSAQRAPGAAPATTGAPRNALDLVLYVENRLGYVMPADWPGTQQQWREVLAGEITRAMARRPGARSMTTMVAAVEMLVAGKEQLPGRPGAVLPIIADEIFLTRAVARDSRELQREEAQGIEQARPDCDLEWLRRLTVAHTAAVPALLIEWRQARGMP